MAAASSSLKEYLKRYQSADDPTKKKKKKKPKPNPAATGVLVVDEDPVWQKPVQLDEEESDSSGEEKPLIEEDIEVKRMKRLEAIRSRKPYHAISEDGSGWVSVPSSDLSSQRLRRERLDTPSPDREQELDPEPGEQDLSPPRKRRLDTPSPDRPKDRSGRPPRPPPRRRRLDSQSPEPSPPRRRESSATDLSPPRKRSRESAPGDLSPPRRSQPQENLRVSDLSPPRRSLKGSSVDRSPPRKSRESLARDLSPPRRRQSQENARAREPPAGDLSPPRRSSKGSSVDLSPPRKSRRGTPTGDLSPPRRRQSQENARARESPGGDLSPPKRSLKVSSVDLSPPRRRSLEPSRAKEASAADLSPPRRRKVEAPKTGLLSAKDLKEENVRNKNEELSRYESMDPSLLGKDAKPVFRKDGKRISKEELLKQQEEEKPKEKKLEWGKGLAQKREAEAMAQELELEKDKPFARTRDDPDLDNMLKERLRWGDPMAHLVKKKHSELVLEDLGDDEKMKESGFIVPQTVPPHSWIKRGLDFPPNRYDIRPGRHWDGVDRSTGYEKEMFKRQNEKRATESEAYLWSVSDM